MAYYGKDTYSLDGKIGMMSLPDWCKALGCGWDIGVGVVNGGGGGLLGGCWMAIM